MGTFDSVIFKGTFRDCQKDVLSGADKYLRDGKIHVVAAPGSGKTVLGLELIRRLGSPALVLSPSVTIRQQWLARFAELFLPEGASAGDYLSCDLDRPAAITSVTYQALHAAMSRLEPDFDLAGAMRSAGIGTVCLDEAHHLRSEWQKSLEAFLAAMPKDVKRVSLTATPPYDAPPTEWARYLSLCGEIDAEIYAPQLVWQGALCPHQDYVHISTATGGERKLVEEYHTRARACMDELMRASAVAEMWKACMCFAERPENEDAVWELADPLSSVASLAAERGMTMRAPTYTAKRAEEALQFALDHPEVVTPQVSETVREALARNGLIERRRVRLASSDKLDKMLAASAGKLASVAQIAREESAALGDGLRMLALTDYIKRDTVGLIGSSDALDAVSTVSVFESIRRAIPDVPLGILSGSLVVAPDGAVGRIMAEAEARGVGCASKRLAAGYSELRFTGEGKHAVALMTEAFSRGVVRVLVGTAALLGEGWDAPCVNALVLASFVSSYMLSNQMRGRAIRADRESPDKTANIWHLVTAEPGVADQLSGADWESLSRRFDGFLAPAYDGSGICTGVERLTTLTPPFDARGAQAANARTLALAADRAGMARAWKTACRGAKRPAVRDELEVAGAVRPKDLLVRDGLSALAALLLALAALFAFGPVGGALTLIAGLLFTLSGLARLVSFRSEESTVRTLANCALAELKRLDAADARAAVRVQAAGGGVCCRLENADTRAQALFTQSMRELLSPIDNPRYVLVGVRRFPKGALSHARSFACPSAFGQNKETAERFANRLGTRVGALQAVYARGEEGRRTLLACRRLSWMNAGDRQTKTRRVV